MPYSTYNCPFEQDLGAAAVISAFNSKLRRRFTGGFYCTRY
jgi:hypothetical protein